ncbi:hypothetical protein A4A49_65809, partial [Nicotiana attenuata]
MVDLNKISYARVLVKVDITKPMLENIEIVTPSGTMQQEILYEWKPKFCSECIHFGHDNFECWRNKKQNNEEAEFKAPKRGNRIGKKKTLQEWKPKEQQEQDGKIDGKGEETQQVEAGKGKQKAVAEDTPTQVTQVIPRNEECRSQHSYSLAAIQQSHHDEGITTNRNKVQERASLWHDLQILGSHIQIPWLISGDFNNVLTTKDRLGQLMTTNEVHDFKQCIDNMQLTPLKTKGCFFTWCNKQNANDRVYSKIDWAFGNFSWTQTYGHLEADFLKPGVSDQSPIVVQLWKRRTICSKPFKLYMVTIDHKDFTPMVNRVWQQQEEQDKVELIWLKLKRLKDEAKGLNKAMASYEQRPTQIRQSLECVQAALVTDPFNQLFIEQEKQNMSDLEKWSTIEEIILRQKSRATWIDYGDSNSKYFYAQLKIRANKNNITSVYNDLGIKITDPKVVEKEFTEFFTQLMGNANGLMPCPNTSIIK